MDFVADGFSGTAMEVYPLFCWMGWHLLLATDLFSWLSTYGGSYCGKLFFLGGNNSDGNLLADTFPYKGSVMFQSITIFGQRRDFGIPYQEFNITDTDFGSEIWVGTGGSGLFDLFLQLDALIKCYESKKLDVAFNLALYHRLSSEGTRWGRGLLHPGKGIRLTIENVPGYKKYAEEVKRYMERLDRQKAFE